MGRAQLLVDQLPDKRRHRAPALGAVAGRTR